MDTLNESHPVHSAQFYIAAQSTGTASLTDVLARAVRIASDTLAVVTATGDLTADRLRGVVLSSAQGAADMAHIHLGQYQEGWLASTSIDRELAVVVGDLRRLADRIDLAYRVGVVEVEALHVAELASGLARTIQFRAEREAKAARKAERIAKAVAR